MVVGVGITSNGVPFCVIVLPCKPGGASASGIVVWGTTRKVLPPTIEVGSTPGSSLSAGNVVGFGITIMGVLFIISVIPTTFGGAFATAIVVAANIVTGGAGETGDGRPPIMEFINSRIDSIDEGGD
jgi:hypothetical protein